jgi:septum formation inhibitor-activating ATPase MinD
MQIQAMTDIMKIMLVKAKYQQREVIQTIELAEPVALFSNEPAAVDSPSVMPRVDGDDEFYDLIKRHAQCKTIEQELNQKL